ncbi:TPA: hypothetical protein KUN31_003495 [Enterobacter cloacae]|nr:hypothetical protein [Enterobacter cloacae]
MNDSIKEIAQKAINSRLKSPWLGYISFSWLACNWTNLAFLFMGTKPIEDKINQILSKPDLWTHYFWTPVFIGFTVAFASPYIDQILSLTHSYASQWKAKQEEKEKSNIIKIDVKLKNLEKFETERIEKENELNLSKIQESMLLQQAKNAEIEYNTSSLKEKYDSLLSDIEDKNSELSQLKESVDSKIEQTRKLADRINRISELYFKFDKINTQEDFFNFMESLNDKSLFGNAYLTRTSEIMINLEKEKATERNNPKTEKINNTNE